MMNFKRLREPAVVLAVGIVLASAVYTSAPPVTLTEDFVHLMLTVASITIALGGVAWAAFEVLDSLADFDPNPSEPYYHPESPIGGFYGDKS